MFYFLGVLVVLCIAMSLRTLFYPSSWRTKQLSFDNFLFLAFTYSNIVIGFGLLYLILDIMGFRIALNHGRQLEGHDFRTLMDYMYLSAVTLFSVGYGDIVPIGAARILIVIEALIGYTIPAAFVVKSVLDSEKK
ncbi:LCTB protein [Weizmannia acidilactici]|uniref:LCTB protein n=1 Tax=Weizmannia acidilactici TaxID=2607726 RepID=A0A5J4JH62_9BACI|nr:potassium channel family protein [Weizmannia acidilactici]GER67188.1 LCTB protein [Weizmannia acidilactici]GER69698.1 LCTB protein [Weizmannia acidilactici]GER72481.1 LCTB protein [Weizmannia acidilactici]